MSNTLRLCSPFGREPASGKQDLQARFRKSEIKTLQFIVIAAVKVKKRLSKGHTTNSILF